MCAIFGILGEHSPAEARKALSLMQHRGPDYCGIIEEERLFFAHNRLSIIDSDIRSHQPFKHERIAVSFNGEIYNYKELRNTLPFDFKTQSDTEVIIAAYLHYGSDFVQHLRGMFAIALLDGETLYLFRDRFGKKPLYYYEENERFIFASEIKAIRPFLKSITMNDDALMSYLSFSAPTPPHTFYNGIKKLESGSYLKYHLCTTDIVNYYDVINTPFEPQPSIHDINDALHDAITSRLHADVPVAGLLSGGIDSAMIAAIARQSLPNFTTFTLGYKEYASYDERANAVYSAAHLGVTNHAVEIDQKSFLDAIPQVFETMDEPLNDPAAIPLYLLFKAIKQEGYKVVLSGEGSDEIFLGYRHYREYHDIEHLAQLKNKNWLKKYFRANFWMNREWEWYKRVFNETLLFRTSGEKFTDLQKNMLFKRNVKDEQSYSYLKPFRERFLHSRCAQDETLWYSYIDLKIFQAEHFLSKLDRVSMAHSIESRTPFLDHHLIEKIFSLNAATRLGDNGTKNILKSIASSYMDETMIHRKKKGFSNPYMEYLNASNEIDLIRQVNKKTGLFKDDILERYIQRTPKGRFKHHVWGLYVLSHWIQKNLM